DVYFTPIYMKKNRPATKLSVICKKTLLEMCEDIIFKNLSTIGVRKYSVERTILERKIIEKDTQYGTCQFKVCTYQGETYQYPEYEYVKKISMEKGISFGEAYHLMKMI
ncbi:MAG: nickel insertion protein, partial [Eubacteriales bacterium]